MGELFDFLTAIVDDGAEIHLVDMSDPKNPVEHVLKMETDCSGVCNDTLEKEEVPFEDDSCPYDGDCSDCPYEDACAEDLGVKSKDDPDYPWEEIDDDDPPFWGIPDVRRIVFSCPATIVFWEDDTKTVVKCMEGEKFERYAGFAAACMKKMFGSTSRAKSIMEDYAVEQVKVEKEKKEIEPLDAIEAQVTFRPVMDASIQEAVNEALNG